MLRLFRSISRGRGRRDGKKARQHDAVWSPFTGSPDISRHRAIGQAVDDDSGDDEEDELLSPRQQPTGGPSYFDRTHTYANSEEEEDDNSDNEAIENEDAERTPLLPIFSAAHLDRLPLYNITHAIRLLIVQKCETTLSWDQLRSPQISQFLVKPIQSQIRTNHFNRATICALVANCLQFHKEGQTNPGNAGVSKTRALISELLAMRLMREFSTHELIDALSYDFDPLQGMTVPSQHAAAGGNGSDLQARWTQARGARVSTIEIAIRAEAKRLLAHPLVVQHLEAIWSGNIVFHSEADNLHRKNRREEQEQRGRLAGYGTTAHSPSALPADSILSRKAQATRTSKEPSEAPLLRRSVTLYDPRDASLFKLSRLRVPRYRQVFSTLSFATMLGLFVAVLYDRSRDISALEILFWFWSAGYMLDEVVGFTEQGFGLYILSFWNAFDLGILCLFAIYYCLRLYGIIIAETGKHRIAWIAYDVLASTAILLFPRLFSVLDHYRYFSQLLIAFRMMAQDLIAILVLIMIFCSGFFVAFTLSFADDDTDGNAVAYALFQILMGFTPAAWDVWEGYNILGKALLAAFLIICHFLIVTILITVLTNSFMAIVKNAEEEHQFMFAINTISMVKSDALFSYVPPSNIIGWILSPLRLVIPLRQFVKINRLVIKITHFPILFAIFAYERMIMARHAYAPTELIERQPTQRSKPVAFQINNPPPLFSPHRLREPSVMSFSKDRALDEVFRRPFKGSTLRTTTQDMDGERPTTAVDNWMQAAENEGGASPPLEQPRSVLERLEGRRPTFGRASTAAERLKKSSRVFSTATKSVASDTEMIASMRRRPQRIEEESEEPETSSELRPQETDADDEIDIDIDNNDESDILSLRRPENRTPAEDSESEEYFRTPTAATKSPLHQQLQLSAAAKARLQGSPDILQAGQDPGAHLTAPKRHQRNLSTGTMLFAPQNVYDSSTSASARANRPPTSKRDSAGTGSATPITANLLGARGVKIKVPLTPAVAVPQPKPRPIMPPRQKTAPNLAGLGVGLSFLNNPSPRRRIREPSFNARALDLASEIGDNKFTGAGGIDAGGISGMPASFSEQLMRERELQVRVREERRRSEEEEKGMVNRIMLARMHTLEEGFREIVREIQGISAGGSRRESEIESAGPGRRPRVTVETGGSASGGTWATGPKTPKQAVGRIGGMGKSPRKVGLVRRGSKKGKENERPGSGGSVRPVEGEAPKPEGSSPESVKSVVEVVPEEVQQAGEGAGERVPGEEIQRKEE